MCSDLNITYDNKNEATTNKELTKIQNIHHDNNLQNGDSTVKIIKKNKSIKKKTPAPESPLKEEPIMPIIREVNIETEKTPMVQEITLVTEKMPSLVGFGLDIPLDSPHPTPKINEKKQTPIKPRPMKKDKTSPPLIDISIVKTDREVDFFKDKSNNLDTAQSDISKSNLNNNENNTVTIKEEIVTAKVMFSHAKRIPPIITLHSPNLVSGKADFFIDTGSQVSLIKSSALTNSTYIDKNSILRICSITNDYQYTKGKATILLENLPCNLHIIDDVFCMDTPGLIGLDILEKYNGNIDIANMQIHLGPHAIPFTEKEKFRIQPRSKQIIYADVANSNIKEGFLPLQNIHPNLFLGEALVKNESGKALVMCINTSSEEIKIDTPLVVLEQFDQIQEINNGAYLINDKLVEGLEREQLVNTIFDLLYKKDLNEKK